MGVTLPILMFHSLDTQNSELSFPPELFRMGLQRLQRAGFRTVTMSQAATLMQDGGVPGDRLIAITFDDGYRSVFDHAFPVLRTLGYTATVFVNTGSREDRELAPMEGRPRMSWSQIRSLREAGVEIGAHTQSHPDLTTLDAVRIEAEVKGSQEAIEAAIGARTSSFAYPFGRYNQLALDIVSRHFQCACSTKLGVAGPADDIHALPRLEMHYFRNKVSFAILDSLWLAPYLTVRGLLRESRRKLVR